MNKYQLQSEALDFARNLLVAGYAVRLCNRWEFQNPESGYALVFEVWYSKDPTILR